MVNIIVVTIAVFSLVSFKKLKVSFPFINAIIRAPIAPIAAASVGVAIPPIIEPSTNTISINGRANVFKISIFGGVIESGKNWIFKFFEF